MREVVNENLSDEQYIITRHFTLRHKMRESIKNKIIQVCDAKIKSKGPGVGLSFYAFFSNKNDDPELLMEVAEWWILTNKFDHFEKATKIKRCVEAMGAL